MRAGILALLLVAAPLSVTAQEEPAAEEPAADEASAAEVEPAGEEPPVPAPATAPARKANRKDGRSFFNLVVGAKGGAGGNLWTESKSVPLAMTNFAPFDGMAGGWSAGAGIFAEFRAVWGYVGLEFDLMFERNTLWTEIKNKTNNYTWSEAKWLLDWTNVRIPLLLKGYLPVGNTRLTLAIGPEFVVGVDPKTSVEYTSLNVTSAADKANAQTILDAWNAMFEADKQTYTALTVGLGIAFEVWKLAITFDIRYSYYPSQPEDYLDRVDVQANAWTYKAFNSMDLHLLLGVAYELDFDIY